MTFTREELENAEAERPPSGVRRLLLGLGIGFIAFSLGGTVALVPAIAIPLAWTWAGAGVLLGFGVPATTVAAIRWLDPVQPGEDAGAFLALIPVTGYAVGCAVVGFAAVLARLVLAHRGRDIDEAAIFRTPRSQDRAG